MATITDAKGRTFSNFAELEKQVLADAEAAKTAGSDPFSMEDVEFTTERTTTTTTTQKESSAPGSDPFSMEDVETRLEDPFIPLPPPPPADVEEDFPVLDRPRETPDERERRRQTDVAEEIQITKKSLPEGILEKKLLRSAESKGKALSEIRAAGERFVIKRELVDSEGRINTIQALRSDVSPETLRRAGLSKEQVEASVQFNKELTALEKIKVATPSELGPRFVKDTMKELFTFGAVETESFNRPNLKGRYQEAKAALSVEWDRKEAEAQADGQRLLTSKSDFILQNIGTEKAYVAAVLSAQPALASIAKEFGLASIPVYGTIRTWNESPNWARALRAASDILFVVPILGQAGAATRAGVGFTTAAKNITISTVTGVPRALRHPLRTVQKTAEPIVDTLNPRLVGAGGNLTVRDSTIRLPAVKGFQATPGDLKVPASNLQGLDVETGLVTAGGRLKNTISASDLRGIPEEPAILAAMEWRDQVTLQAIQGKPANAPLPFGEGAILTPEIQRRVGPAAIHNTPDLRPWLLGNEVGEGGVGDLYFAPGVMSRFVKQTASGKIRVEFDDLPRRVQDAVTLGQISSEPIPGALLIRDPDLLAQLAGSNKLWQGSAEIELTLKAGVQIPPPSQFLYFRDAAGRKVTLAVVGEPFSPVELAKMKILGAGDTIKSIFSRPGQVTANKTTEAITVADETVDLLNRATVAESKGAFGEARVLRQRAAAASKKTDAALSAAQKEAADGLSGKVEAVAVYTGNQDIDAALKVLGTKGGGKSTATKALDRARASAGVVVPEDRAIATRGAGTLGEVASQVVVRNRPSSVRVDDLVGGAGIGRVTINGNGGARTDVPSPGRPGTGDARRGPRGTFIAGGGRGTAGGGDTGRGGPGRGTPPERGTPGRADTDIPRDGDPGRPGIDIPRGGDIIRTPPPPPPPGITRRPPPPPPDDIRRPPPPPPDDPPPPPPPEIIRTPPTGGGGRAGGFLLPSGERLKAGLFPRVVTWPQGENRVTANLLTGKVIWEDRVPDGTTPEEGFRVIQFGRERPPRRLLEMGITDVQIGRDEILFRARPKRPRPSISRRLIRRG